MVLNFYYLPDRNGDSMSDVSKTNYSTRDFISKTEFFG